MQVRRRLFGEEAEDGVQPFADACDYGECLILHRQYGTSYYYASLLFPSKVRRRTHAVYGFVRVADEWVDNPGPLTLEQRAKLLDNWRSEFLRGLDGVRPSHPAMRAFCDVCREVAMPIEEPLHFLEAMRMDLTIDRYPTYEHLRCYMKGSAAAVGIMMCSVTGAKQTWETFDAARKLGEAMQLTNFIRDVGEDAARGRIYIPQEDLASFEVDEDEIIRGFLSDRFIRLLRFEIERARTLYASSRSGDHDIPFRCRPAVRLARVLYEKILDKIEENGYDVFRQRAHTTKGEKIRALAKAFVA